MWFILKKEQPIQSVHIFYNRVGPSLRRNCFPPGAERKISAVLLVPSGRGPWRSPPSGSRAAREGFAPGCTWGCSILARSSLWIWWRYALATADWWHSLPLCPDLRKMLMLFCSNQVGFVSTKHEAILLVSCFILLFSLVHVLGWWVFSVYPGGRRNTV